MNNCDCIVDEQTGERIYCEDCIYDEEEAETCNSRHQCR